MILHESFGTFLIVAGIVSFVALRLYKGKFRYIFLILGIGFIGVRFTLTEIKVLKGEGRKIDILTFGKSIEYKFQSGKTMLVPISDNTLINDTQEKLFVEEVEYSTYSSYSEGKKIVERIDPYSFNRLTNSIDYYFKNPPKTIRVKGGGTTSRYWLHN